MTKPDEIKALMDAIHIIIHAGATDKNARNLLHSAARHLKHQLLVIQGYR